MTHPVSPLAPKTYAELPPLSGVRLASIEAGIKYKNRKDLTALVFDAPAAVAGVFTRSACASAPVDWCKEKLSGGVANCVVINSGNANAFTGMKGKNAVETSANAAATVFDIEVDSVFLASTGVIGEPLDASGFEAHLGQAKKELSEDGWMGAARAIMTTDTYPKLATAPFELDGMEYRLNGIAKGSGMIAPDMATMLGFIVTDAPIAAADLQRALSATVEGTFNAITVDSDTSTSDTVLLLAIGGAAAEPRDSKALAGFHEALQTVSHDLAMQIVRDGEGATKQVEIQVTGAASNSSARTIALAIANSPLVKTAIAGEDANWGRIVMAVGKSGEPADRDRLQISFGDVIVARNGERVPDYSEEAASAHMRRDEVTINVDIGLGEGFATVWTCDLTKRYVEINGDYRS